jgi:membrane fusion protein (multidrug efflux system)
MSVLALTDNMKSSAEAPLPATARDGTAEDELRGPPPRRADKADAPVRENRPFDAAISPEVKQDAGGGRGGRRSFLRRHPIAAATVVAGLVVAASGGYVYWDYTARFETTDDAFIEARQFSVAPKVSGSITAVPVTDNQHVNTGDVIARIDDRDFRTALDQAQAQVAAAAANISNIDAQTNVQQAQITASQAQVEQAEAAVAFAQQQQVRYQDLAAKQVGTVEMAQQVAATLRQDQAAVKSAQATVTVAERQLDSLKAQRGAAEAALAEANAQRDQAQLNLSYTTVTAAQPGRVANLTTSVGQYVQAGTALSSFVPDEIWVTANYKETQLDQMRPSQPATVHIDAYPGRTIHGQVASIQPGSGTAFSLLPAENATGNFVKVVQRVPVKIVMETPPADVALGPGMSVEPSVRVDAALSLYERVMGRK